MTRIASLTAGQAIKAGYRGWHTPCEFLGFSDNTKAYSETPAFNTLADLKTAKGARNAAEIEQLQDQASYGHSFYALFRDLEDGTTWAAYLWKGAWRVGSSADRLQLAA
jgi:hypothetical protein